MGIPCSTLSVQRSSRQSSLLLSSAAMDVEDCYHQTLHSVAKQLKIGEDQERRLRVLVSEVTLLKNDRVNVAKATKECFQQCLDIDRQSQCLIDTIQKLSARFGQARNAGPSCRKTCDANLMLAMRFTDTESDDHSCSFEHVSSVEPDLVNGDASLPDNLNQKCSRRRTSPEDVDNLGSNELDHAALCNDGSRDTCSDDTVHGSAADPAQVTDNTKYCDGTKALAKSDRDIRDKSEDSHATRECLLPCTRSNAFQLLMDENVMMRKNIQERNSIIDSLTEEVLWRKGDLLSSSALSPKSRDAETKNFIRFPSSARTKLKILMSNAQHLEEENSELLKTMRTRLESAEEVEVVMVSNADLRAQLDREDRRIAELCLWSESVDHERREIEREVEALKIHCAELEKGKIAGDQRRC